MILPVIFFYTISGWVKSFKKRKKSLPFTGRSAFQVQFGRFGRRGGPSPRRRFASVAQVAWDLWTKSTDCITADVKHKRCWKSYESFGSRSNVSR